METMIETMTKRINKQAAVVIALLAIVSVFFTEWRFPLSIIIGGIIFLASFWVIIWAVRKFAGKHMAQPIIMGISTLKILLIFAVLIVLAILKLINITGLVIGFTVSLIIMTKEGFIAARKES